MKHKHLENYLQRLQTFNNPRLDLEQYATTPELAASILMAINEETLLEDGGKLVAGTGMISANAEYPPDYSLQSSRTIFLQTWAADVGC